MLLTGVFGVEQLYAVFVCTAAFVHCIPMLYSTCVLSMWPLYALQRLSRGLAAPSLPSKWQGVLNVSAWPLHPSVITPVLVYATLALVQDALATNSMFWSDVHLLGARMQGYSCL
jgi:hypothetical protein